MIENKGTQSSPHPARRNSGPARPRLARLAETPGRNGAGKRLETSKASAALPGRPEAKPLYGPPRGPSGKTRRARRRLTRRDTTRQRQARPAGPRGRLAQQLGSGAEALHLAHARCRKQTAFDRQKGRGGEGTSLTATSGSSPKRPLDGGKPPSRDRQRRPVEASPRRAPAAPTQRRKRNPTETETGRATASPRLCPEPRTLRGGAVEHNAQPPRHRYRPTQGDSSDEERPVTSKGGE